MAHFAQRLFFGCSVVCVFFGLSSVAIANADNVPADCSPDKLIVYKAVLHTFWTSSRFPKHYPQWRPPAQWSMLIGRSHGKSYSLFRIGQKASPGMKMFAEMGKTDELNGDSGQGENDVYDVFGAPAIPTGTGRTETQFIVDGNHSLVSLASRIVPSPDWFIGLDSFNLCVNGNWLDSITIEANPMDAGTDNGFTFTAPNWPTEPQGVIFHMSSKYPSHPAGSFYYPQLKRLPPIATFQFIKVRAYDLSEVFYRTEDEKNYEVFKIAEQQKDVYEESDSNEVDQEIEGQRLEQEIRLKNELAKNGTVEQTSVAPTSKTEPYASMADLNSFKDDDVPISYPAMMKTHRHEMFRKKKKHYSRDCKISEWGEWSDCSVNCGVGEMRRKREILKHPKGKGSPCPPLIETKWCRNNSSCNDNFLFKW